ncbi:MAG: DUF420 domain-containing protein [Candidatus Manganitrophaceae bacterium]|nr:MAG: DUF420 domain-containing protein [Candidatus Manganitrophaceae bacterium]
MKEFLNAPGFLSPYGTLGADVSSVMAWIFTLLFIYGWYAAKKSQGQRHHLVTLWGMIAMLGYFTLYYLARGLGALSVEGKEGFGGPDWVYSYIFTPMLTIHILVISIGLVLAVYMIVLGFRSSFKKGKERYLKAEPLKMGSKGFNYTLMGAAVLFGGVAVVRWGSMARFLVYVSGFGLVAAVLLLERGIEQWMPDAATRHRKMGAFTMALYVIALVTSTTTYVMLYYIYPVKAQ